MNLTNRTLRFPSVEGFAYIFQETMMKLCYQIENTCGKVKHQQKIILKICKGLKCSGTNILSFRGDSIRTLHLKAKILLK
jgi:hypothetical protein